ncbi:MAG: hypothetical protein JXB35_08280 [Anaerolineae bacterium]|nr:hypothetical protein [Anaerolineae bacterium]
MKRYQYQLRRGILYLGLFMAALAVAALIMALTNRQGWYLEGLALSPLAASLLLGSFGGILGLAAFTSLRTWLRRDATPAYLVIAEDYVILPGKTPEGVRVALEEIERVEATDYMSARALIIECRDGQRFVIEETMLEKRRDFDEIAGQLRKNLIALTESRQKT